MIKGFWEKLKKPIFVLAPMANVTDVAFRRVIAKYGKPDVMWTEFVSADGLFLRPVAKGEKTIFGGVGEINPLLTDLMYTEAERPIVAQFFTSKPETMYKAAQLAVELGFDGVDINMGCPDKSIEKQGAGAAMMKNPRLAREVLRAAMDGASQTTRKIPVSVKTRVGFNKVELESWLPEILAEKPAAVTIHARTRKEMSKVPARWERVKRAVEIRNQISPETLILGNGDVLDTDDARRKCAETGADGVMLGRAIFGNPWLFSKDSRFKIHDSRTIQERLRVMVEHTKLFEELLGDKKNFAIMKKHYKAYVHGWDGAKELRALLMEVESADEVGNIVEKYLKHTGLDSNPHSLLTPVSAGI